MFNRKIIVAGSVATADCCRLRRLWLRGMAAPIADSILSCRPLIYQTRHIAQASNHRFTAASLGVRAPYPVNGQTCGHISSDSFV